MIAPDGCTCISVSNDSADVEYSVLHLLLYKYAFGDSSWSGFVDTWCGFFWPVKTNIIDTGVSTGLPGWTASENRIIMLPAVVVLLGISHVLFQEKLARAYNQQKIRNVASSHGKNPQSPWWFNWCLVEDSLGEWGRLSCAYYTKSDHLSPLTCMFSTMVGVEYKCNSYLLRFSSGECVFIQLSIGISCLHGTQCHQKNLKNKTTTLQHQSGNHCSLFRRKSTSLLLLSPTQEWRAKLLQA
jgi:hypothetical protein